MINLRPRLLVDCEPDLSMLTRGGWMKLMVTEEMGRLAVATQLLAPDQVYLSVPMPTLATPIDEVIAPRNRHERRKQAARERRSA